MNYFMCSFEVTAIIMMTVRVNTQTPGALPVRQEAVLDIVFIN